MFIYHIEAADFICSIPSEAENGDLPWTGS